MQAFFLVQAGKFLWQIFPKGHSNPPERRYPFVQIFQKGPTGQE